MDRRKLLIADDSEMNRAMLANMLDHDFQIIEAVDGHETISALEMYKGEIAALLLDIVMPEMDGFQVLEEMQRRGWTESVPTIMISAEMGSAYIDRAFELNRLRNAITNQGRTDVEFFGWFSKARKLQVVISSFDEINDEALQWAANKLEAQK